jgi:N-acetylneuraminate synthase
LPAALAEICRQARHGYGLSTLLAEPANGDPATTAALIQAGYRPIEGTKRLRRELVAEFWRARDVCIIAEAGSNWRMGSPGRDLAMAKVLIEVAAAAGADAVKFQSFRPETLYAEGAGSSVYLAASGITATMEEMFADLAMPHEMLPALAEHARAHGIAFMSTAFSPADFAAVDPFVGVHKIASYEISHIRLIELAARSGKPTVMSTGAATLADVAWAVDHYHRCGGRDLCLMQCTAKYPAPLEALNLAAIPDLARMFGVSAGLSDHSRDPVVGPLAAVALGARAIEKHFTLGNRLPGPDHAFAVSPDELRRLVEAVRAASAARGTGVKAVLEPEMELASFAQRGVQATRVIAPGDLLTEEGNIAILRPGRQAKGVHPRLLPGIAGRRATRELRPGEGLRPGDWSDDH